VVQLFEDVSSVEKDTGVADATPEGQALLAILNEIDTIARATLGSITIATMQKLLNSRGAGRWRSKPTSARGRTARRA
jgi:hypothetical protein